MIEILVLHLGIRSFAIHLDSFGSRDPEHVVTPSPRRQHVFPAMQPRSTIPYQNLTQCAGVFPINILLCVRKLDVHVGVDTDQSSFVFCLSPL
jgi:hypothetical protein